MGTGWVIGLALLVPVALLIYIIVTDGRYFGKRLVFWIYDFFGPAVFTARSEVGQWQALAEMLGLRGDERILDAGTAAGDLPISLAQMPGFSGYAVGVDWSPRMIAAARRDAQQRGVESRTSFEVVDARRELPFDEEAFDVIFCLGMIESLPTPGRLLTEFERILKPGGVLALSVFSGWSARIAAISEDWYRQQLSALGFGEFRSLPLRRHHNILTARKRHYV